MATEECFRELSPTLAIHNGDTNFKSAALEAGTLLVRPWTTIPVTLSEDMDKDSEVRSLLKDDHQTKCSYPDHLNANKPDFQSQHRFSLTLSSTSSCNDNNDTFSKFPNKRPEDLSSNYSSSKTVQRKQRICSWFYGWGNGLLTALLLFGCAFLLTFLLGLLIGYYVKVGGKLDSSQEQSSVDASNGDNTKDDDWTSTENCYQTKQFLRRCKPDPRLDSIHGNIMYYVNGDRMTDYIRLVYNFYFFTYMFKSFKKMLKQKRLFERKANIEPERKHGRQLEMDLTLNLENNSVVIITVEIINCFTF